MSASAQTPASAAKSERSSAAANVFTAEESVAVEELRREIDQILLNVKAKLDAVEAEARLVVKV
jgi:hypothetical protein